MICIQVVPRGNEDVYKLLRDKVSHEANTWAWTNKAKTRLAHVRSDGYIEVGSAEGVLIARIFPKDTEDEFYLSEKFIGRLVAWFDSELAAINVQLVGGKPPAKSRKKAKSK